MTVEIVQGDIVGFLESGVAMKYLLHICVLLSVFTDLFFVADVSIADAMPGTAEISDAEMIDIAGVHLHCPGCAGSGTRAEFDDCEIRVDGEFVLLPCNQALDIKLREFAALETYPAWLNERELLRLLFQTQRLPSTTRAAYALLFKSPIAERIFSVYAKALLLRHPLTTASLINDGFSSAQVLEIFWNTLPVLPQTEAMEIRAAIIAREAKFGLQDSVVDSELSDRGGIVVYTKPAQQLPEIARPGNFYAAAIVCGLLLFSSGLAIAWRKRTMNFRASEAEKMLAADYLERKEFAAQLSYFELPANAKLAELSAEYRRRAKIFHPDTSTGSASAFAELNLRYEQARNFMRRKRR